jgi:signal transduction histidine kinase
MIDTLPKMLLDSMTSGILAVDLENHILFVNAALSERLSTDQETWWGKPAPELFRSVKSSVPATRSPLYHVDSLQDAARTYSREVEWNDGTRIVHLREDSGPLRDESGRIVGRLYAYHDLSWEKTIDQMKSEFISIASHELRTPMTSIKGSVDLILGGCAGEVSADALELLEVAHSASDRMIRLINDILDLSKIEAGHIKLKLAPISLSDVVERALRGLRNLAAKDEITFKVERPQNLPCVEADSDRIEQVVTNLLFNAMKFSPTKGEISVGLSGEDGWVSCSVSDQGCGIREEDLDRIFGKFQQVGSPQRGGGTGLGLAITHALVTEHRGKIWVESRVGEGSCFVFRLPVAAVQSAK